LANFKLYHILYFKIHTSLNKDIVVTTLVVQLPQETTKVVTTNKIANVKLLITFLTLL